MLSPAFSMSLPKPWAVLQPTPTIARKLVMNSRTRMRLMIALIFVFELRLLIALGLSKRRAAFPEMGPSYCRLVTCASAAPARLLPLVLRHHAKCAALAALIMQFA